MLKVFYFLLAFLRELVYDSKDEYSYTSSKFNIRKGVVFALLVFLIVFTFLATSKVIRLSATIVELKSAIIRHNASEHKEIENYKARISELELKASDCNGKGKKQRTSPSDSGISGGLFNPAKNSLSDKSILSIDPYSKTNPKKHSLTREQENALIKEYLIEK